MNMIKKFYLFEKLKKSDHVHDRILENIDIENKFEIGDRVIYIYDGLTDTGSGKNRFLLGLTGEIIDGGKTFSNRYLICVQFDEKREFLHDANGRGKSHRCYFVEPETIEMYMDQDEFLKRREELKKQKELRRLKHIDVDPYGEEEWED